jgi:hypothetical protein
MLNSHLFWLNSHPARLNQVLDTPDVQVQNPWSWSRNAAGCEFNQKRCEFKIFQKHCSFFGIQIHDIG